MLPFFSFVLNVLLALSWELTEAQVAPTYRLCLNTFASEGCTVSLFEILINFEMLLFILTHHRILVYYVFDF